MAWLPGKFVWFEHVSNDVAGARTFHEALFGWKTEALPMGDQIYHMIKNGQEGIGGYRTATPEMPNHWMSYLSVADVDATTKAAAAAGAKILMPPTDFPPVGRGATIADPAGAVVSIWKSAQGDRADIEKVAPGDWYWNECMTSDAERALAFYEKVFGYGHQTMNMANSPYHLLTMDGLPRGGIMKSPDPQGPPGWLPYVAVADCDASAGGAKALGGRVVVEPTDIPEVGRFAVLVDPCGAALGIIRGARTA